MITEDPNQVLHDALVRHQVYLLRFSDTVKAKIVDLLNEAETDLQDIIERRLANATGGLDTSAEMQRLQTLLQIVSNARRGMWSKIDEVWLEEMVKVAQQEPTSYAQSLKTSSPTILEITIPTARALKAIVNSHPFEGRTLKEWSKKIANDDIKRIEHEIRKGMVEGQGAKDIAKRIIGTAKMKGQDGVTQITRNNAEAITRTAINAIASEARRLTAQENKDILQFELFVATLDSRTTPICRATDGEVFEVGKGRQPPLHFNCRSLRVPLFGEAIGKRPSKAVTEKQLLREWAKKNGLSSTPTSRDDLTHGTKTRFDEWARGRIRELTKQVPAKVTYQEWLDRQSAAFQDDILGKTRGALFRRGGLTLDKFVNRAGDEINLHDLARLERQAFIDAGLDPDAY